MSPARDVTRGNSDMNHPHLRGGGLKPEGGAPPDGNPGGKPGAPGKPVGGGKAPPNPGGGANPRLAQERERVRDS